MSLHSVTTSPFSLLHYFAAELRLPFKMWSMYNLVGSFNVINSNNTSIFLLIALLGRWYRQGTCIQTAI